MKAELSGQPLVSRSSRSSHSPWSVSSLERPAPSVAFSAVSGTSAIGEKGCFFSASKVVGNVSHCCVEATDLHLLEVVDADVRHKCRIWKQVKCWLESGNRFKRVCFLRGRPCTPFLVSAVLFWVVLEV